MGERAKVAAAAAAAKVTTLLGQVLRMPPRPPRRRDLPFVAPDIQFMLVGCGVLAKERGVCVCMCVLLQTRVNGPWVLSYVRPIRSGCGMPDVIFVAGCYFVRMHVRAHFLASMNPPSIVHY